MDTNNFNPWKNVDNFGSHLFNGMSSDLVQWPIKIWKISPLSPYFHKAHLLIAADCSAFSCPTFHETISKGKIPLICCPENDFDITDRLSKIFLNNEILSATVVRMETACCNDLVEMVKVAVKFSRLPVPLQITNLFVTAETIE